MGTGVALGGVALKYSKTHFLILAIYGPIWMKPMSINHKFFIDYIIIIFESATPLLVGVALGGVALKCSKTHFLISAIYGPIWTKPMSINHKFFIDYIFIIFESATPLLVGVTPKTHFLISAI